MRLDGAKEMASAIRVGAVSYLNAKPLYYRLTDFAPNVRLTMDLPSRLAEDLARGELDVALIPSIEYFRSRSLGYEVVPGFAIAARGAVRSVKLFSRVPFSAIDRLALDEGSRTSQALGLARRGPWRSTVADRDAADGGLRA
jgi:chorismate dehydratase